MKHYLFCLRHFNDIDNITPAIHFLLERRPVRVTILIYSLNYDYRSDPSLQFLQKTWGERLRVFWIGALAGYSEWLVYSIRSRYWSYLWRQFIDIANPNKNDSLKEKLASIFTDWGAPEAAIFDQNRTYLIAGLLNALRSCGVSLVISLPVSPWINVNVLRQVDLIRLDTKDFKKKHDYSGFDAIGQADPFYSESMTVFFKLLGHPSPFQSRERILGSIRYSDEWLNIRKHFFKANSPMLSAKSQTAYRRRLLVLPSHQKNNSFWDEYLRTLQFISQFDGYDILVKPHTRYGKGYSNLPKNILLATEADTSGLIDWSDIILFWSSSVVLEGFQKGKTMINLNYLNGNRSVFTLLGAGYSCNCRDDLLEVMLDEGKMKEAEAASVLGRDLVRRNIIEGGLGVGIVDRYVEFCESPFR